MPPNTDAIIRVGGGRGFIIEHHGRRYVITAAHCLTRPLEVRRAVDDENEHAVLPPPMPAMYDAERLYPNLLGPIDGECDVSAECLFVDPVADIAVRLARLTTRSYPNRRTPTAAWSKIVSPCP